MARCSYFLCQYSQCLEWWLAHSRSSMNLRNELKLPVCMFKGDPRVSPLNLRSQCWLLTTIINTEMGYMKSHNSETHVADSFENLLILEQTGFNIWKHLWNQAANSNNWRPHSSGNIATQLAHSEIGGQQVSGAPGTSGSWWRRGFSLVALCTKCLWEGADGGSDVFATFPKEEPRVGLLDYKVGIRAFFVGFL